MKNISHLKGMNHSELCFDDKKLNEKFIFCKSRLQDSVNYELNADTVLLDSFHSATIEGARTTIENVKNAINAPKSKSDIMVVNNMKALDKVYSGFLSYNFNQPSNTKIGSTISDCPDSSAEIIPPRLQKSMDIILIPSFPLNCI